MATLEKLRNKAGVILIAFIGLALLSFILSDIFGNQQGGSIFGGNPYEVAKINGHSVHIQEYQELVNTFEDNQRRNTGKNNLDESTRAQIMKQAWDMMTQKYIMEDAYKELGIYVTGEELFDLIQGKDPHPIIRNNFTNPETGELNRTQILQFLKSMTENSNPEQKAIWLPIEQEIYRQQKLAKYNNLVQKAMFVTPIETHYKNGQGKRFDINYVLKRYSSIPDSLVTVEESDLKDYYNEHKEIFRQDEKRSIEYVAFEVEASPEDEEAAEEWINDIAAEFKNIEQVKQFVNLNSDIPFDGVNYSKEELPENLQLLFDAEPGTMHGPYRENQSFKVAKLAEINYLPDSVHARHILIQPTQQTGVAQAQATADSLLELIKNGASFEQLAMENSQDRGSAAEGGDLGWFSEGAMVKPFNDTVFYGNTGDIKLVNSQFGIHIVEILEQSKKNKKVQVGVIVRNIVPSDETFGHYYRRASKFAAENRTYEALKNSAEQLGLRNRRADNIERMTLTLYGLESPRELVRWVYEAELNDVSEVFEFNDKFVVASLVDIQKEGIAPFEEVKDDIEFQVLKEKKAEKLINEIDPALQQTNNLTDFASAVDEEVKTSAFLTPESGSLEGAGYEKSVIAVASVMEEGKLSKPIEGTNGIYVIEVTNLTAQPITDEALLNQLETKSKSRSFRAGTKAYDALKEKADIKDKRPDFY